MRAVIWTTIRIKLSWVARVAVALLGIMIAAQAGAVIVETSAMTNSISYGFANVSATIFPGASGGMRANYSADGFVSEMGIETSNILESNGNFSFMGNAYCVGSCSILLETRIVFTLTNTGSEDENIRFDSLITPGHVSEILADGTSGGLFNFSVVQTNLSDPSDSGHSLYTAYGSTGALSSSGSLLVATTSGGFNGFTSIDNGTTAQAADWSATNLNLVLDTIKAGETHTLLYNSQINLGGAASCTDLDACNGIQIAFGDPRNNGSASRSAFAASVPYVGLQFDPYDAGFSFVPVTDPLPELPDVLNAPVYRGPLFASDASIPEAVPEPATWAMMILGFGFIGAILRRLPRRQRRPAARWLGERTLLAVPRGFMASRPIDRSIDRSDT